MGFAPSRCGPRAATASYFRLATVLHVRVTVRTGPGAFGSRTATPVALHTSQSLPGLCLCEVPSAGCSVPASSIHTHWHLIHGVMCCLTPAFPRSWHPPSVPATRSFIHSLAHSLIHQHCAPAARRLCASGRRPTRQTRWARAHGHGPGEGGSEREGWSTGSVIGPLRVCFAVFYFCGPESTGVPVVRPQCPARVFTVNVLWEQSACRE